MEQKQIDLLNKKLPNWAIKDHPTKKNMTVIHPMAVIERLNDVFGIGGWQFTTEYISCDKEVQEVAVYRDGKKTNEKKDRTVYMSAVKGRFQTKDIILEQFGGSTNDDKGDALKGGATDALTKIASYLNIGAEIYKGQGNQDYGAEETEETAFEKAKRLIAEEDDLFGLRNLERKIAESTKLTDKEKTELAFIANEKALSLDPTKN